MNGLAWHRYISSEIIVFVKILQNILYTIQLLYSALTVKILYVSRLLAGYGCHVSLSMPQGSCDYKGSIPPPKCMSVQFMRNKPIQLYIIVLYYFSFRKPSLTVPDYAMSLNDFGQTLIADVDLK